jgi:hypothetical protein
VFSHADTARCNNQRRCGTNVERLGPIAACPAGVDNGTTTAFNAMHRISHRQSGPAQLCDALTTLRNREQEFPNILLVHAAGQNQVDCVTHFCLAERPYLAFG